MNHKQYGTDIMKKTIETIKKKLNAQKGFSLGELMAATIILLLASQVLAQGMAFAVRMYNQTLTKSHGKQLCSTLTATIETELRYTTTITTDSNGNLRTYFSPSYGQTQSGFLSIDKDDTITDKGEIAIKATDADGKNYIQRLLSSASYSSYNLKAKVDKVQYDTSAGLFHVTLTIYGQDAKKIVTTNFDVIPVNNISM